MGARGSWDLEVEKLCEDGRLVFWWTDTTDSEWLCRDEPWGINSCTSWGSHYCQPATSAPAGPTWLEARLSLSIRQGLLDGSRDKG